MPDKITVNAARAALGLSPLDKGGDFEMKTEWLDKAITPPEAPPKEWRHVGLTVESYNRREGGCSFRIVPDYERSWPTQTEASKVGMGFIVDLIDAGLIPVEQNDEDRAKQMFNAYNSQGPNPWKTFDGRDVPKWDELNDQVRAKWTAAAAKAREIFGEGAVETRLQHLQAREHQILDLCSLVGVAAEEELEPAIKRLVERQDNAEELEERMAAAGHVVLNERVTDTRDIERVAKEPHYFRRMLGDATFKAMYPDIAARLEKEETDGKSTKDQ